MGSDLGLPKGIYLKHGAYYTVKRNRWIRLGSVLDFAMENKRAIDANAFAQDAARPFLSKLFTRAKNNAKGCGKRKAKPFSLTLADVIAMYDEQAGACAVSSIPFDMILDAPSRRMPFAPSIDRIDSRHGYSRDNCRLVCVAVNYAMNAWGASALRRIARHMGDLRQEG